MSGSEKMNNDEQCSLWFPVKDQRDIKWKWNVANSHEQSKISFLPVYNYCFTETVRLSMLNGENWWRRNPLQHLRISFRFHETFIWKLRECFEEISQRNCRVFFIFIYIVQNKFDLAVTATSAQVQNPKQQFTSVSADLFFLSCDIISFSCKGESVILNPHRLFWELNQVPWCLWVILRDYYFKLNYSSFVSAATVSMWTSRAPTENATVRDTLLNVNISTNLCTSKQPTLMEPNTSIWILRLLFCQCKPIKENCSEWKSGISPKYMGGVPVLQGCLKQSPHFWILKSSYKLLKCRVFHISSQNSMTPW